jgi:hypothetical protein
LRGLSNWRRGQRARGLPLSSAATQAARGRITGAMSGNAETLVDTLRLQGCLCLIGGYYSLTENAPGRSR